MFVETVKIQNLSNNSFVIGSEKSGQCVVIDPVRDIDQYTAIASNHGVRIAYVLETHVHNDFISGARELASQTGCQVGASASGGLLYPSLRLQEGNDLDLGEFKLRVMHTPGHTPESVSLSCTRRVTPPRASPSWWRRMEGPQQFLPAVPSCRGEPPASIS